MHLESSTSGASPLNHGTTKTANAKLRHRWVAFLSGEAIISIPNSDQRAHIQGGKHGLIFVADTTDVSIEGHLTMYPGDVETTALQIPTADGQIPAHVVLCKGVCGGHDDRG